jgi:hypothetical protein
MSLGRSWKLGRGVLGEGVVQTLFHRIHSVAADSHVQVNQPGPGDETGASSQPVLSSSPLSEGLSCVPGM